MKLLLKKIFYLSIISYATIVSAQTTINKGVTQIDTLLKSSFFDYAQIALSIYDVSDSQYVYRKNEKLLLHPASNMKILTSAAALLFLDTNYFFTTKIFADGKIKDSVLIGNIYIKGGCDPDFTSEDLDTLILKIKQAGINNINGNVYGDISMLDSLFWGKGWMWDDDPSTDFPYFTPLTINDNAVKIVYEPGEIGEPIKVKTIPNSNFFKLNNISKTYVQDTSSIKINRDWINRTNEINISGFLSYISKPDTLEINIFEPKNYFLTLFKEKLSSHNISFSGKGDFATTPIEANEIASFSRSYKKVITNLNKNSDNLSAEMTLRAMGFKHYGSPSSAEKGLKLIDSLISIASPTNKNYRIVDGSGVSHYTLINSEIILDILKYFYYYKPRLFQILKNSFPLSGFDGSLKNRMKDTPAYKKVYAKTGTLSGVSALSGFINSSSEKKILFSILIQNYTGSSKHARKIQDKICEILSNIN